MTSTLKYNKVLGQNSQKLSKYFLELLFFCKKTNLDFGGTQLLQHNHHPSLILLSIY